MCGGVLPKESWHLGDPKYSSVSSCLFLSVLLAEFTSLVM